ncbi:MAG: hypothetical protein GY810_08315 [Aureispira sp.]|nr:hypothetical protein [Aureispira sp.]
MTKRVRWTLLGFLLFLIGAVTLSINLVGLKFSFMAWIDTFGQLPGFIFKVALIVVGIVIAIVANSNEDAYDEYFDGDKYKVG